MTRKERSMVIRRITDLEKIIGVLFFRCATTAICEVADVEALASLKRSLEAARYKLTYPT